jgi:prophage tail gpP-like protein
MVEPGEWHGLRLEDIVAELTSPFDIDVRLETETGSAFDRFRLQPGETAWEAIERACRMRAVLAMSDGAGALVLTRAGVSGAASDLLMGGPDGNILSARRRDDWRDRFSDYVFLAQRPGTDDGQPADFAHVRASAMDPEVRRSRPLMTIAEDVSDGIALQRRARWEAIVRRGRSSQIEVTVQGWTDRSRRPWAPNHRVRLIDRFLGADEERLITEVRYRLSEAGAVSSLTLSDPDTFEVLQ